MAWHGLATGRPIAMPEYERRGVSGPALYRWHAFRPRLTTGIGRKNCNGCERVLDGQYCLPDSAQHSARRNGSPAVRYPGSIRFQDPQSSVSLDAMGTPAASWACCGRKDVVAHESRQMLANNLLGKLQICPGTHAKDIR